tara:strand:+ start:528 stop:707 length:180 start_codon:yes stop_codon:yes gene_type:complete
MDLPINDEELSKLVWWTGHMRGDLEEGLHKKLKLVKEVREKNPDGPYKKILREEHGMVI